MKWIVCWPRQRRDLSCSQAWPQDTRFAIRDSGSAIGDQGSGIRDSTASLGRPSGPLLPAATGAATEALVRPAAAAATTAAGTRSATETMAVVAATAG